MKITKLINESRKRILREAIRKDVNRITPKKILDDGAGIRGSFDYGRFKNILTRADISTGINCENLPFKDSSFDLVIFAGVIQYVKNPNRAMSEAIRVIKPRGKLIISTININSIVKKLTGWKEELRAWSPEEFENFVKSFNLKIIKKELIDFKLIPKKRRMIIYLVCEKA